MAASSTAKKIQFIYFVIVAHEKLRKLHEMGRLLRLGVRITVRYDGIFSMELEGEIDKPNSWQEEVDGLPQECRDLLNVRDGGWTLCNLLPALFPRELIGQGHTRKWEVCGLALLNAHRFHEALAVFEVLYYHMLDYEISTGTHLMKGMPLVWMSDCHRHLGRTMTARRLIMLTLVEDAVANCGQISPARHGSYFRASWVFGISHKLISHYANEAFRFFETDKSAGAHPEWILQQLDQRWISGYPSPGEVDTFSANTRYVNFLLGRLGDGTGQALEILAEYLMSIIPGCRVYRRRKSHSTDYDLVCAMEGVQVDFRAEFGRYFVCECKDWSGSAGTTEFAKFCRVLDSVKAKFGILFSKNGISGRATCENATREQLKVFQDRGVVIVVVDESDLKQIAEGESFLSILRSRYETVRLDLETA